MLRHHHDFRIALPLSASSNIALSSRGARPASCVSLRKLWDFPTNVLQPAGLPSVRRTVRSPPDCLRPAGHPKSALHFTHSLGLGATDHRGRFFPRPSAFNPQPLWFRLCRLRAAIRKFDHLLLRQVQGHFTLEMAPSRHILNLPLHVFQVLPPCSRPWSRSSPSAPCRCSIRARWNQPPHALARLSHRPGPDPGWRLEACSAIAAWVLRGFST